jgi:hypothetical protein
MNERFKKLADSVGLGVRHDGIVLTKNVNAAEAFEQFAELIIRECVAQCEKNADHEWLGSGSKLGAFNIKQHFGVEE